MNTIKLTTSVNQTVRREFFLSHFRLGMALQSKDTTKFKGDQK